MLNSEVLEPCWPLWHVIWEWPGLENLAQEISKRQQRVEALGHGVGRGRLLCGVAARCPEGRSSGARPAARRHAHAMDVVSGLSGFKRKILNTQKGILLLGLIITLTVRVATNCFFYLVDQVVCMCLSSAG